LCDVFKISSPSGISVSSVCSAIQNGLFICLVSNLMFAEEYCFCFYLQYYRTTVSFHLFFVCLFLYIAQFILHIYYEYRRWLLARIQELDSRHALGTFFINASRAETLLGGKVAEAWSCPLNASDSFAVVYVVQLCMLRTHRRLHTD
jgi:hypothetical protein